MKFVIFIFLICISILKINNIYQINPNNNPNKDIETTKNKKLNIIPLKINKSQIEKEKKNSNNKRVLNNLNNANNSLKSSSTNKSKFQDVLSELRSIKIELFGNPEENMDFYKRNRNIYDGKILQRSMKISKVLELEELLDFYNTNTNKDI